MKNIIIEFSPMAFYPDPEQRRREYSNARFKAEGILLPPYFQSKDKKDDKEKEK